MGVKQRRAALAAAAEVVVAQGAGSDELRAALAEWLKVGRKPWLRGRALEPGPCQGEGWVGAPGWRREAP